MGKIKKYHEHVSHYAYVTYFKDEGMYKVKASVHVHIEEGSDNRLFHEVTDVDLEFFINDKKCAYSGFKEMYGKLFGENKFNNYERELYDEFTENYLKNKVKIKEFFNLVRTPIDNITES